MSSPVSPCGWGKFIACSLDSVTTRRFSTKIVLIREDGAMLSITETARGHFRKLLDQQGIEGLGVRIKAIHAGTPKADCQLEFCESGDLAGDERQVPCDGFIIYVDRASVPFLEGAELDYQTSPTGGQLSIRAPKIKGDAPAADAPLAHRVQYLLDI